MVERMGIQAAREFAIEDPLGYLNSQVEQTPEDVYECEQCGKLFSRKWNLERHLSTHQIDNDSNQNACDHPGCTYASHQLSYLNNHKKKHARNREKHTCSFAGCTASYTTKRKLDQHKNVHKGADAVLFKCTFRGCTYSSKMASNYRDHQRSHKARSYACPIAGCSYRGKERAHVRKHQKRKHRKPELPGSRPAAAPPLEQRFQTIERGSLTTSPQTTSSGPRSSAPRSSPLANSDNAALVRRKRSPASDLPAVARGESGSRVHNERALQVTRRLIDAVLSGELPRETWEGSRIERDLSEWMGRYKLGQRSRWATKVPSQCARSTHHFISFHQKLRQFPATLLLLNTREDLITILLFVRVCFDFIFNATGEELECSGETRRTV